MSTSPSPRPPFKLPSRRSKDDRPRTEPSFDPTSWGGALIVMGMVAAALWIVQFVNVADHYRLVRFGLRPRRIDGLWGILTQPFLHENYGHLISNTVPLVLIGWALLLSGVRTWLFVTGFVVIVGDLATWLVAPSGLIVGASGAVFGWMGYLLSRAYFSRKLKWILTAVAVLFFFGTLLGSLLPDFNSRVSWPSHLCGFAAGVLVGAVLHPRRPGRPKVPKPASPAVS